MNFKHLIITISLLSGLTAQAANQEKNLETLCNLAFNCKLFQVFDTNYDEEKVAFQNAFLNHNAPSSRKLFHQISSRQAIWTSEKLLGHINEYLTILQSYVVTSQEGSNIHLRMVATWHFLATMFAHCETIRQCYATQLEHDLSLENSTLSNIFKAYLEATPEAEKNIALRFSDACGMASIQLFALGKTADDPSHAVHVLLDTARDLASEGLRRTSAGCHRLAEAAKHAYEHRPRTKDEWLGKAHQIWDHCITAIPRTPSECHDRLVHYGPTVGGGTIGFLIAGCPGAAAGAAVGWAAKNKLIEHGWLQVPDHHHAE